MDDIRECSPLSSPPSSVLSSPLSSPGSTPSPPPEMGRIAALSRAMPSGYPSPPASQQTSLSSSPSPDGMDSNTNTDVDCPPPAKRRRITKDRSTEYVDLRDGSVDAEQQADLDHVLHVLHKRRKIVVIAGAGISVSAGSKSYSATIVDAGRLTNHPSQYPTSALPMACSEVSKTNTNLKDPARTYLTRRCTRMTRRHHHFMTWSAPCRA